MGVSKFVPHTLADLLKGTVNLQVPQWDETGQSWGTAIISASFTGGNVSGPTTFGDAVTIVGTLTMPDGLLITGWSSGVIVSGNDGWITLKQATTTGQFLGDTNGDGTGIGFYVPDHGALDGLGDNDHPQYALTSGGVVKSLSAGTGITLSGTTGAITITGHSQTTGSVVTSITASTGIAISGTSGAIIIAATGGGTIQGSGSAGYPVVYKGASSIGNASAIRRYETNIAEWYIPGTNAAVTPGAGLTNDPVADDVIWAAYDDGTEEGRVSPVLVVPANAASMNLTYSAKHMAEFSVSVWAAETAYTTDGDFVIGSGAQLTGKPFKCVQDGSSGFIESVAWGDIAIGNTVGEPILWWKYLGGWIAGYDTWGAATEYTLGATISNAAESQLWECVRAGTSGDSEPMSGVITTYAGDGAPGVIWEAHDIAFVPRLYYLKMHNGSSMGAWSSVLTTTGSVGFASGGTAGAITQGSATWVIGTAGNQIDVSSGDRIILELTRGTSGDTQGDILIGDAVVEFR